MSSREHRRSLWRKLFASLAGVAVTASALVGIDSTVNIQPAYADDPMLCNGNGIYTHHSTGEIREFREVGPEKWDFSPAGDFHITNQQDNALGVSNDGRYAYSLANGSPAGANKQLTIHDRLTNTHETRGLGDRDVPAGIIRGAVDPTNGYYYYGGHGSPAYLGVYNPETGDAYQVGNIPGINGQNGDFAFTADGQLIVVANRDVYAVQADIPTRKGNVTLPLGDPIAQLPSGTEGNGIAFGNYGNIYVSTSNNLYEVNLATGQIVNTVDSPGVGFTDLASCAFPNTVQVEKNIQPDRYAPTDQFELLIEGPTRRAETLLGRAETTGTQAGIQDEDAGPYITARGEQLDISEAGVDDTSLDYYTSDLQCFDAARNNAPVEVTGEGPNWSITQPDFQRGSSVVCTVTNTALQRALDLTKTSDPTTGTSIDAGQEITYTVTATNTGEVAMDVEVTDDLTDVLEFSELHESGVSAVITDAEGEESPAAAPDFDSTTRELIWGGNLGAGEAVTIMYTVTANNDAAGQLLTNTANASATPPNNGTPPEDPPAVITEHPVNEPGFTLDKTVNPATGTAVNAGDVLEYTLEASNTGGTGLTDVQIVDDLNSLLERGTLDEDSITALINGNPADPAVSFDQGVLTWNGDLAAGETLVISFDFSVGSQAAGETLFNTVSAQATPPGGTTITPEDPEVSNPVNSPGFDLTKEANPPSGEALYAGDEITYTITGSNTGETPLKNVTLTDDATGVLDSAGIISGPTATIDGVEVEGLTFQDGIIAWNGDLAVGEDVVITYTVVINDDAAGSTLENQVTGSATPPGTDEPIVPEDPPVVEHPVNNPAIELDKTGVLQADDSVQAGDVVEYTFVAINTGDVTLTDVVIEDPLPGLSDLTYDWPGAPGVLNPGQIVEATATLTLTQHHIDGGLVVNLARVEGTPPPAYNPNDPDNPVGQDPVEDHSRDIVPLEADPAIDLVKEGVVLVDDAEPAAGDTVTYTLTATNTGNVTLTDVSIEDGLEGIEDLEYDWSNATAEGVLAPGETVTLTGVYTLTQADINAGAVINLGTTTGTPPNIMDPEDPDGEGEPADPVVDEDPETVTYERNPALALVKQLQDDQAFSAAGDTVIYEFVLTNVGTTSLSDLTITDDLLGDDVEYTFHWDDSEVAVEGTLAPGESVRATAAYVLTQEDVDRGWVHNVATGGATPPPTLNPEDPDNPVPSEPVETPPDEELTELPADPALELTKSGSFDAEAVAGSVIEYTFVATNTGNVTLTDVSIDDPLPGLGELAYDWPGETGVLVPGASVVATAQYTVTQADVDAGVVLNTATAGGTPPPTIDPQDPETPEPNDPIETPPAEEDTPLPSDPNIELEKTSDVDDSVVAGDYIEYTLVATNTGNVTLSNVSITDRLEGLSELRFTWPQEPGVLAPGESVTATASLTLTQDHLDGGLVRNTATTIGTPPDTYNPEDPENPTPQDPVDDDSTVITPLEPHPAIDLKKTGVVNGETETPTAGETVTYAFEAKNTGNVTLRDVDIVDPLPGLSDLTFTWPHDTAGVLAPGESVTATAQYVLTQQDANAGAVVNLATTIGTPPNIMDPEDPDGEGEPADPVEDDDPETVTFERNPELALVKQLQDDQEFSAAGDTVIYEFVLTNVGTTSLSDLTITDDLLGEDAEYTFLWEDSEVAVEGTLEPGDVVIATAEYVLTQEDVDRGWVHNVATGGATPPPSADPDEPNVPVETPPSDVITELPPQPDMTLEKTGSFTADSVVGETIDYRFVATNTGNVTLTDVYIDDPLPGLSDLTYDWPGETGVLVPGASVVATAQYTLTQADIDAGVVHNSATAGGTPPPTIDPQDPETPEPNDPIETPPAEEDTPLQQAPDIELVKTSELADAVAAGETLEYTFVATNTGNVTLTNESIDDPMVGLSKLHYNWPGEHGLLAPGESVTATASLTLTQEHIDQGLVENTATVEGTPPPAYNPEDPENPTPQDPVTDSSTVVTPLEANADITLVKTGVLNGDGEVGDVITYTFTGTNTGAVTLTNVMITDELEGLGALDYHWPSAAGILAPGEQVIATAQYTLTQADIDAGEVENFAAIEGTSPAGDPITADDTNTITWTGLAVTGASILTALGIALFTIALGIVLVRARGRKETV